MIVAPEDLETLTGYRRPSAQSRWLRDNGWKYTVNVLGHPVVALDEFKRQLVGGRTPANQTPIFEAINGSQKKN
jgi:hypothetical protein